MQGSDPLRGFEVPEVSAPPDTGARNSRRECLATASFPGSRYTRAMRKVASLLLLFAVAANGQGLRPARVAPGAVPPARFADPERAAKLATAFPEIEKLLHAWVERQHAPGAVMGVVIDDRLAWVTATGVRDVASQAPFTTGTVSRIASMTKSFTAMAIVKLRDEGKLSLDDPVSRYLPELANLEYPTRDSRVITIRDLLTHSAGFPEDNPWGDRQLAQSRETMSRWMRAGIPFSTSPGTAYEYSNYGFAMLGEIVERVAKKPYSAYVRDSILLPLGMTSTTFDIDAVARDRMANGFRWEDETWKPEPALGHGSFGAMGGLWTSADDLARWVAFLMSAFPPRDEAERGPVSRASAREMQQAWRAYPSGAFRSTVEAPLEIRAGGYGYGLRAAADCRFAQVVGHGGGLPGYGSLMLWLPEYGVGLIGMANITYAPFGSLFQEALSALEKTGALKPRVVQPSPALLRAKSGVSRLIVRWDDRLASEIAADNLDLDESFERRARRFAELAERHGVCREGPAIEAENALRGGWRLDCERGHIDVSITLAPTNPPRVQALRTRSVLPPDDRMSHAVDAVISLLESWDDAKAAEIMAAGVDVAALRRHLAAAQAWGRCRRGGVSDGNGTTDSTLKLDCEKGGLAARVELDPSSGRVRRVELQPSRDRRCVP